MRCLGIESSCDETAIALVVDGRLEDSVLASQTELHALFGGVVPELASREHYRFIGPLFDQLLQRNKLQAADLDVIAVARGPGLLGSLLVGVAFAKALSLGLGIPLLGVNHLHAHLLATGLEHEQIYPALGLLVSGGHTHLYHIASPWQFVQLGKTLDDAAGEAFDKTGSFMGIPYPAGKQIDLLASGGIADAHLLPRPYLDNDNLDFSFSGLKTAALNYLGQKHLPCDSQELKNFCASFNLAVAETLCAKSERAIKRNPDIKSLWMAGGVAANSLAREKMTNLSSRYKLPFLTPSTKLCTDNGAMIAFAGYLLAKEGFFHTLDMEAVPRGRIIPDDMKRTTRPASTRVAKAKI